MPLCLVLPLWGALAWWLFGLFKTDYACAEERDDHGAYGCSCTERDVATASLAAACVREYDCCFQLESSITFIAHAPTYDGPKVCSCFDRQPGRGCGESNSHVGYRVDRCPPQHNDRFNR